MARYEELIMQESMNIYRQLGSNIYDDHFKKSINNGEIKPLLGVTKVLQAILLIAASLTICFIVHY